MFGNQNYFNIVYPDECIFKKFCANKFRLYANDCLIFCNALCDKIKYLLILFGIKMLIFYETILKLIRILMEKNKIYKYKS